MNRSDMKYHKFCVFIILLGLLSVSGAGFADQLDRTKYIGIDEIEPGMDAYCLSVYSGTEVEKFPLEVLSVVKNFDPGRNGIVVIGTDERFKHTGAVQGCSGSPVYINGRMAGALAMGFGFGKDPLYIVTPIADMLDVGSFGPSKNKLHTKRSAFFGIDYSKAVDLSTGLRLPANNQSTDSTATKMLCPAITNLPASACEKSADLFKLAGLRPISAAGAIAGSTATGTDTFEPGGVISIPLITGDITIDAVGTVTEIVDDRVYAFGHHFLGQGPIELPMTTGKVHAVIASRNMSFKLATSYSKILGTVFADESTAIAGRIGAAPPMVPLNIKIDRFNDIGPREYNCSMAADDRMTPMVLQMTLLGIGQMKGRLPDNHTVTYQGKIAVEGFEPIEFANFSSNLALNEVANETIMPVAILMNNPYEEVKITGIDLSMKITPEDSTATINHVQVQNNTFAPGDTVKIETVLLGRLNKRHVKKLQIEIPENTPPGKYKIIVAGGNGYESFLRRAQAHKYTSKDLPTLVKALRNVLEVKRDRLYAIMELPTGGVVIDHKEIPSLPGTKAMLLTNPKRTTRAGKFKDWIVESVDTGLAILDSETIEITVEK